MYTHSEKKKKKNTKKNPKKLYYFHSQINSLNTYYISIQTPILKTHPDTYSQDTINSYFIHKVRNKFSKHLYP